MAKKMSKEIRHDGKEGKEDIEFIAKRMKKNEENTKKRAKQKNFIISMALLALILILALTVRIKISNYVFQNPVAGEHTITERIPYETFEAYTVTEEYKDSVPFGRRDCRPRQMEFNISFNNAMIDSDGLVVCSLVVQNLEDEAGNWSYTSNIEAKDFNAYTSPITLNVPALSSVRFEWRFDVNDDYGQMNCKYQQVALPSMIKCFYAEPITYQTVIKTRTVERNKTVIDYKEVQRATNETTYLNSTRKVTLITFLGKDLLQLG